jgi:hypothetical protein
MILLGLQPRIFTPEVAYPHDHPQRQGNRPGRN